MASKAKAARAIGPPSSMAAARGAFVGRVSCVFWWTKTGAIEEGIAGVRGS